MSEGFGLSISGESIKKAQDASEMKMSIPDTARKSDRNQEVHFWEEAGTITSASSSEYTKDNLTVNALTFETTISAEGSGLNVGFPLKTVLRICPAALATGQPDNYAKMSLLSVNKLVSVLRGAGIVPDEADGGYSDALMSKCFGAVDGFVAEPSPLLGKTIRFEMKYSPFTGRDGKVRWQPEIMNVFEPL